MHNLLKTIVAASALLSSSAFAGLSANVGFVSDYYFRGANLGDGGAYVGLDYEAEHGSRFDVRPRAALLSMPVLLRADGFACLPYLHGFEHAADLKLESSFPALEHYCSQHDLPLLEIAHTVKQSLRDEKITRST